MSRKSLIEIFQEEAMEDGRVYDGSNMPNQMLPCPSPEVLDSLWIPNSSPSFHGCSVSGSTSMVNFEVARGDKARDRPFFSPLGKEDNGNEDYDGRLHQPEKKRRLTSDQLQFLERSFEVENKLEPERKIQIAKELGLQPRQVSIWFQNRRARYKCKQLEKDYNLSKAGYDKLKANCDNLLKENEKLKNEVIMLKDELLQKVKAKAEPFDDLINSLDAKTAKPVSEAVSDGVTNVPSKVVVFKQEDASSAKSDIFDSNSPHYVDVNHSSFLEPANSSHLFEPDQSDFSQDEEDNLSRGLLVPPLPMPCFPKLEDECYNDPSSYSCNMGFQAEDQLVWFWSNHH